MFPTISQQIPPRRVYGKYKDAGIENIKLMVIGRMGHTLPAKKRFIDAIEFLDARITKTR